MTENFIPAEVRTFIVEHIHSIAQLEALLLLRSNPGEQWTAEAVSRRIYAPASDLTSALERLCADGFLGRAEGVYRYDPADTRRRELVDRLARLYSTHLIPVTNIIHDRDRYLREFSDAFKLKKDK